VLTAAFLYFANLLHLYDHSQLCFVEFVGMQTRKDHTQYLCASKEITMRQQAVIRHCGCTSNALPMRTRFLGKI